MEVASSKTDKMNEVGRGRKKKRGGRGVESGSGQIKRGADLGGNVWPRFRESVDFVFTCGKFPHR